MFCRRASGAWQNGITIPICRTGGITAQGKRMGRSGCCPTGWGGITGYLRSREKRVSPRGARPRGDGLQMPDVENTRCACLELDAQRKGIAIQFVVRAGNEVVAQVYVHRVLAA